MRLTVPNPNRVKSLVVFLFIFGIMITCVHFSSLAQGNNANDCMKKMGTLPSINFQSNSSKLLPDAKKILETIAIKMRNNPSCKIVVIGYGASSKMTQQRSWDHVNTVITYLVEAQGIAGERFIFEYGSDAGLPTVTDLRVAGPDEEGPSSVAPPFPNMRKK